MKPSRVVNIGSGNVGRRYVMPTYSGHIPKSKVCTYGLALTCAGLKGLKKHFGKKQKKIWLRGGSNSRPPDYKPTALSITPRVTDDRTTGNT